MTRTVANVESVKRATRQQCCERHKTAVPRERRTSQETSAAAR